MRNSLAVFKKELRSYFASTIAYVVLAIFLAVTGYFFSLFLFNTGEATLNYLFLNAANVLLLVAPLLTMRLLAEEQRLGTMELLLTSPMRDWEMVVGKFLAAFALVLVMVALTIYTAAIVFAFGTPDPGPILTGYLAVVLLGAALLSIGLLASSLSQNQLVAAVVAFGLSLMLWNANSLATYAGSLAGIMNGVALSQHFLDFTRGRIQAADVFYYISVVAVCLFFTTRIVEKRRWD